MLARFREFGRHLKQNGARMALYYTGRHLLWQLTQRLPISVLYYGFELRNRFHPGYSDANPLKLVWVSPRSIEYIHDGPPKGFGEIASGDWDRNPVPVEESRVYESLKNRFHTDTTWEETELFRQYKLQLENGSSYWRCTTLEELRAYFDEIDKLYANIKERGYKSQRHLLLEYPGRTHDMNNDAMHPVLNEISVNIFRDGTFAKSQSGMHRLAIANLLDIKQVPVVVRARHAQWQAIRDDINTSSSPTELDQLTRNNIDNPDLDDIVPVEWRDN